MSDGRIASVIIPAHNEGAVIDRCLRSLISDALGPNAFEIVVVANGCTDDTVAKAKMFSEVTVIEVETAGKSNALNVGDKASTIYPRAFIDADVVVSGRTLAACVEALSRSSYSAASPTPYWDPQDVSPVVRSYMRFWQHMPYAVDNLVGGGIYILSRDGRRRFESFPHLIADDLFVRNLFLDDERLAVEGAYFKFFPPRDVFSLIKVQSRVRLGNMQYSMQHGVESQPFGRGSARKLLKGFSRRAGALLKHPRRLCDLPVFTSVYLCSTLIARWRQLTGRHSWSRDETTRGDTGVRP